MKGSDDDDTGEVSVEEVPEAQLKRFEFSPHVIQDLPVPYFARAKSPNLLDAGDIVLVKKRESEIILQVHKITDNNHVDRLTTRLLRCNELNENGKCSYQATFAP